MIRGPDDNIADLDGAALAGRRLTVRTSVPARHSGWIPFSLLLAASGTGSARRVGEGLFSRGGRGVTPWIELTRYDPSIPCPDDSRGPPAWEGALFERLGALIPAGGHMMIPIERRDDPQAYLLLTKGVPPAATRNGGLLIRAGFRHVKFFYLAEGGWEGQPKLWGEKPPDGETSQAWDRATVAALEAFEGHPPDAPGVARALARARRLRQELSIPADPGGHA